MNGHTFTLPAGHPALPGHFPGQPIVPGVLLLDAVLRAAAAEYPGGTAPTRILRAKFPAPVAPGDAVVIALTPRAGGRIGFTCRRGDTTVLTGELA